MIAFKMIMVIYLLAILIECLGDLERYERPFQHGQCKITPQTYEGPFYVTPNPFRSNIVGYRPGIPLKLTLTYTNKQTCLPIPGLIVTIWQCDAIGYYSHYTTIDPTIPFPTIDHSPPTDGSTFLRGFQPTDKNGQVTFDTIIPGWYANRTHHIHHKVYNNIKPIFTGQLYFTEQLSQWIHRVFPYFAQKRVTNSYDYLYNDFGGNQTTIYDIKPVNMKRPTDGFVGRVKIALYLNATDFANNPPIITPTS